MTGKTQFGENEPDILCHEDCHLKRLLKEVADTMGHAEIFIGSHQKMHKTGQGLYEELLSKIKDVI